MTSSNRSVFCFTGSFCCESPHKEPVPRTSMFLWCGSAYAVKQTVECWWFETTWRSCDVIVMSLSVAPNNLLVKLSGFFFFKCNGAHLTLLLCILCLPQQTRAWCRHQMETFSALLALVREIHRSSVNSPHKSQLGGALIFPLNCAWTNGWLNNRDADGFRRHCAHYDVTVMKRSEELSQYKYAVLPEEESST